MRIASWNFARVPKSMGTHTKFQLQILTINVTYGIVCFHAIILECLRNASEKKHGADCVVALLFHQEIPKVPFWCTKIKFQV